MTRTWQLREWVLKVIAKYVTIEKYTAALITSSRIPLYRRSKYVRTGQLFAYLSVIVVQVLLHTLPVCLAYLNRQLPSFKNIFALFIDSFFP
jgi:hypothetical protein